MDEQAQRIAIAEACGWTRNPVEDDDKSFFWSKPGHENAYTPDDLPDFVNGLDFMHYAERTLETRELKRKYANELCDVCMSHPVGCVPNYESDMLRLYNVLHAISEQRAEAFLRTIGKWEA